MNESVLLFLKYTIYKKYNWDICLKFQIFPFFKKSASKTFNFGSKLNGENLALVINN